MSEQTEEHQPGFSKPAAYGLLAAATAGTVALAVTSPQTLAAGMGSVSTSSAVFVTPVWRFIKRINDMYIDSALYVKADWEKIRGRHFGKPSHAQRDVLAAHEPRFSRPAAYAAMTVSAATVGLLAVYAPVVLAAAFGSVVVSGASFTKPVIDLVQKVNEWYVDAYNYVKGDLSKTKKLHVKPLTPDNHEIDRSIYAPVSETKKHTFSKGSTYLILAAAAVGVTILAIGTPGVLVAAVGTIIGSAISYTSPALRLVKKINRVYDKAEDHIVEGLELGTLRDKDDPAKNNAPKVPQNAAEEPLHISKPMSWALATGAVIGGIGVIIFAPSLVTAAIGGILGAASSFTEPVLKQVGRVNDFYLDASKYLKDDWSRLTGRKPELPLPKPVIDRSKLTVTLTPEAPKTEAPKVETPAQVPAPQTSARADFNEVAAPVTKKEEPVAAAAAQTRKEEVPEAIRQPAPEKIREPAPEARRTAFNKIAEPQAVNDNAVNDNADAAIQPGATAKTPKAPPPTA